MMRALHLAAIAAFIWIRCNQCVMGAPVVTAGFGYFILLDGHVSTL